MADDRWDDWPKPQPFDFDRDAHEEEVQRWVEHYRKQRADER
ncbi:hypothetical protein NYQ35_15965 [Curtobacterium flaccumfaciens pv. flaccumfaciens]|nr:hypothetical protein [Curtobacterium flaccumfaciens]MCS6570302.1 hypothetical protein [Curtobacterium flaccumfaciens pv. flaccumfaciens]MCS6585158.1 hypothetical protein [Curtobacterium flaccumfaciens pv. flaccumfaciens]